jgi:hypothetical protein
MSLTDKFDDGWEPANICSVDPAPARRQFRAALVLVAAMAAAAFMLGFVPPFGATHATPNKPVASGDNSFSGRLVTIDER